MRRLPTIIMLVAVAPFVSLATASAQDASPVASPAGGIIESTIEVDGRGLHLACAGTGEVPVLFETGGPFAAGGSDVVTVLGADLSAALGTRFCAYDRAGTGQSDPDPIGVRTFEESAADMNAVLASEELGCPCVVVGESLGGSITMVAMAKDASNIAGLVLLDAPYPGYWDDFQGLAAPGSPEAAQETDPYLVGENEEFLDLPASFRQLTTPTEAPRIPIVVVTHGAGDPPGCFPCTPEYPTAEFEELWQAGQADLATSLGGRLVVAEGIGHSIANEAPGLVVQLTIEVLAAIESPSTWGTPAASPTP